MKRIFLYHKLIRRPNKTIFCNLTLIFPKMSIIWWCYHILKIKTSFKQLITPVKLKNINTNSWLRSYFSVTIPESHERTGGKRKCCHLSAVKNLPSFLASLCCPQCSHRILSTSLFNGATSGQRAVVRRAAPCYSVLHRAAPCGAPCWTGQRAATSTTSGRRTVRRYEGQK